MARGTRDRVVRLRGSRGRAARRTVVSPPDFVIIVDALVAHRHLQDRTRGRNRFHGDQPRQPPAAVPQAIVDGEKPYFAANWFEKTGNVLPGVFFYILLEIERAGGTDQRADDRMGVLVDPERAGHQSEVEPARNDAKLAQPISRPSANTTTLESPVANR